MNELAYDPFDPAVMADPLPYYRVLREHHPVYYLPQWDTFALSRFADIWDVLAVNDGTFVASEGTLPAATVLARHNQGPVADPPWAPLPFHAVFDAPIYDGVRARTANRSGRNRPPGGKPGSASWPTTGSTSCCRVARSTSPRITAGLWSPRWSANYLEFQSTSPPTCWLR